MNAPRDPDCLIHAFLMEGQTELADQVYDAVRASIDRTHQRVVIGPWRLPAMNKVIPIGLGAAAVIAVAVVGAQLLSPSGLGGVGAAPTPSVSPTPSPSPTPVGGTVQFQLDGAPATTVVDVVVDGASVSGSAVSTLGAGTHSVGLECAARDGGTWAVGGTVEQSTVEPGSVGHWSAVIVIDGTPQSIGIWLSDTKSEGSDCEGWLGGIDLALIDRANFQPVESGALAPPPGVAP
jgi:hypothetical protein